MVAAHLRQYCSLNHTPGAYEECPGHWIPCSRRALLQNSWSHAYICLDASRARKLSVSQTAVKLAQAWGATLRGKVTLGGYRDGGGAG